MFFALAFTAAANPKLLALDLLLIENRRPRAMFASILAGGLSMAIAIGVVDVLFVHAGSVRTQGKVSAGVDLAIGLALLILGALVLAGWLPYKRHRPTEPTADAKPKQKQKQQKGNGRIQRALREPRLTLAFAIGAVCGLPGAAYIAALHNLIAGKYSTGYKIIAVILFAVIEFLLIIVPWLLLELRPEGTAAFLRRSQAWLTSHTRQLAGWICLVLGAYLAIAALARLL